MSDQIVKLQAIVEKLTADVAAETTVDNSILALVTGFVAQVKDLQEQLAAAIAANDPSAIDAAAEALGALSVTMETNAANIQAAVTANTPVVP